MTMQAYIDDSQNNESGVYVLAGYVSTAEKWADFAREWKERLPLAVQQNDGRFRFKMSEMAAFGRMENVSAFHNLIVTHAEASIACILNMHELSDIIDSIEVIIAGTNGQIVPLNIDAIKEFWRNPFYLTFYILLDNFMKLHELRSDLFSISEPIDFYFDETSQKDAVNQGWKTFLSTVDQRFKKYIGADPRFEDDEIYLPLQAADFRAWWINTWATEHGIEHVSKGEFPFPITEKKIQNVLMRPEGDQLFNIVRDNIMSAIADSEIKFFSVEDGRPQFPQNTTFSPIIRRR